jgi:hypothetical protein
MTKPLFLKLFVGLSIAVALIAAAVITYEPELSADESVAASGTGATTSTTTGTPTPTSATAPSTPTIYVSIVTHSEDTNSPGIPNFSTDQASTITERDGIAAFAAMLAKHGAKYDWQSDWNFLLGLKAFDKGSAAMNNKTLPRYLVEDLGMSADPHSHQHNGYNYADVAYLISQLGVTPSGIVGGFIAAPTENSEYSELSVPMKGSKYPTYTWTPTALWGGGTGLHINESEQWTSGIWIPKSQSDFFTPATTGTPVIGRYDSDFNGLDDLLEKQSNNQLTAGNMYTITITTNQNLFTTNYIADFEKQIATYADETAAGKIVWVTLPQALDIWKTQYHSNPTILKYDGDGTSSPLSPTSGVYTSPTTTSTTTKPSSSKPLQGKTSSECGDGVCSTFEQKSGMCSADCS